MGLTAQFEKRLGIGQEGTWGVVGTVRNWIPFDSETFGLPPQPLHVVPQMWNNRAIAKTWQGAKAPSPEFSFVLEPENGIGEVFKAFFGTSAVSQFGTFLAYKHTFTNKNGAQLPSFFARVLEYGTFVYDYTGLTLDKFELTAAQNEPIKIKTNWLGQNRIGGTVMSGTYGTTVVLTSHQHLSILIDNVMSASIKNLKISGNNNAVQQFVAGTGALPGFINIKQQDITGEFTLLLQDEAEITKFINKTSSQLDILIAAGTFTGGTMKQQVRLMFPQVEYSAFPIRNEEGAIGAAVAFRAHFGTNSLGTAQVIGELINSNASYD